MKKSIFSVEFVKAFKTWIIWSVRRARRVHEIKLNASKSNVMFRNIKRDIVAYPTNTRFSNIKTDAWTTTWFWGWFNQFAPQLRRIKKSHLLFYTFANLAFKRPMWWLVALFLNKSLRGKLSKIKCFHFFRTHSNTNWWCNKHSIRCELNCIYSLSH